MATQEKDPMGFEVVDVGETQGQDISFNKLLLWHLNRISFLSASMTKGDLLPPAAAINMAIAVSTLESFLTPYIDEQYTGEVKGIEKLSVENFVGDGCRYRSPLHAIRVQQNHLKALIGVMHRKNLLLQETGELRV